MPTFPRSPRSFRTAGFPHYGWKAGLSGGAFPDVRGLSEFVARIGWLACRGGWRRRTTPPMTLDPPMPFKANADRRHRIPKQRRRVTNWAEYDAALRQRGSLTVWFSEEAIAAWHAEPR